MIVLHLNEFSLKNQFHNAAEFASHLNKMLDMLMPLFSIKDEYVLLTSQALFYQLVQNNQTFSATLSHNNDARRRFQELLQRLNFKYWNKCPKQNFDAQYHESGDLLNNTCRVF
jgi:hypothetical protein